MSRGFSAFSPNKQTAWRQARSSAVCRPEQQLKGCRSAPLINTFAKQPLLLSLLPVSPTPPVAPSLLQGRTPPSPSRKCSVSRAPCSRGQHVCSRRARPGYCGTEPTEAWRGGGTLARSLTSEPCGGEMIAQFHVCFPSLQSSRVLQ